MRSLNTAHNSGACRSGKTRDRFESCGECAIKGRAQLLTLVFCFVGAVRHIVKLFRSIIGSVTEAVYGIGCLFAFSALMALGNTLFAMTIPKPAAMKK
jgi:hypothetical protein